MINLIANSCQALPDKEKAIYVSTSYNNAKEHIKIEVKDEGRGISKEQLPKIFDPFFTTKRRSGGTGLGLSVSATIIKEHTGSIYYESEPGKGTTASVVLPVIKHTLVRKRE